MKTTEQKQIEELQAALLHYSIRHSKHFDYLQSKANELWEQSWYYKEKGEKEKEDYFTAKWIVANDALQNFNK